MNIVEFRKKYPTDTLTLSSGKSFSYRYYKNSQAKTTVVLLTGGIGLFPGKRLLCLDPMAGETESG